MMIFNNPAPQSHVVKSGVAIINSYSTIGHPEGSLVLNYWYGNVLARSPRHFHLQLF
jgi:hypothetical protein